MHPAPGVKFSCEKIHGVLINPVPPHHGEGATQLHKQGRRSAVETDFLGGRNPPYLFCVEHVFPAYHVCIKRQTILIIFQG